MTPRHPHTIPSAHLFGILLALILVVVISSGAAAVTLDSDDTLSTSISNSSMTFNTVTVYVDQATIENTSITIYNASYQLSGTTANLTGGLLWNTANANLDSTGFPRVHVVSSLLINVYSNASSTTQGAFTFNLGRSCTGIDEIQYLSKSGVTDYNPELTCVGTSNGTVTIPLLTGIEPGVNQLIIIPTTGSEGSGSSGGGGASGGGSSGSGNVTITPGTTIQLSDFTIETDDEWHIGSVETITITTRNSTNGTFDPQFVTVQFTDGTIKHTTVRKSLGVYKTTIEAINATGPTTIQFNVTVEDAGKILSKSFTVTLTEASTFTRIVDTTMKGLQGFFTRSFRWLKANWIPVSIGLFILIVLLILAHFMLADKERKEERPYGGLS